MSSDYSGSYGGTGNSYGGDSGAIVTGGTDGGGTTGFGAFDIDERESSGANVALLLVIALAIAATLVFTAKKKRKK